MALAPGQIVGQGRYVLAEKLCDVCVSQSQTEQAVSYSVRGLLAQNLQLWLGGTSTSGSLIPHEGLARAIIQDLPKLPLLPSKDPSFLPAVFDYSVSFVRSDPLFQEDTWGYRFGQRLGKGAYGEVWRGITLDGSMREVVLKRLFVERGEYVRRSGEREIYYGTILQNRPNIARFIESFERQGDDGGSNACGRDGEDEPQSCSREGRQQRRRRHALELWLVFYNEGFSLTHHFFRLQPGNSVVDLSNFWWYLKRQQPLGLQVVKNIIYQVLHAIAVAHDHNITHRDIKMPNVFVTDAWPPVVRLGDWGSALSSASPVPEELIAMYLPDGPSELEETDGYKPPEAMFDDEILARAGGAKSSAWRSPAYDMWSLGVLLLEIVLGSHQVFKVEDRRWLRVEHDLRQHDVPHRRLEQAKQLQAIFDLCIAPPGFHPNAVPISWLLAEAGSAGEELQPCQMPPVDTAGAASDEASDQCAAHGTVSAPGLKEEWQQCTDDEFAEVLRKRDVAGVGFASTQGRDLLRRLLEWSPTRRVTARDALNHPWFRDAATLPKLRALRHATSPAPWSSHAKQYGTPGEDGALSIIVDEDEEEDAADEVLRPWEGYASMQEAGEVPDVDLDAAYFDESSTGAAGSTLLPSGCSCLRLYAAGHGEVGRRSVMEDRHTVLGMDAGPRSQETLCFPYSVDEDAPSSAPQSGFGFLGVYDGHGGAEVAEQLRSSLHKHFRMHGAFPENVSRALQGAFSSFEGELGRSRAAAAPADPGSTALVAVIDGCTLHIANLGDCRAVMARSSPPDELDADRTLWPLGARVEVQDTRNPEIRGQRGTIVEIRSASKRMYVVKLFRDGALRPFRHGALRLLSQLRAERLTVDHKPGDPAERRRIEALGGEVEPPTTANGIWRVAGIAVSRSFGSTAAKPYVSTEPDLVEVRLESGRDVFLVLASDGVWDVLDDQFVIDLVWDHISSIHDFRRGPAAALEGAAALVVETAFERGSMDNLTCVVMLLAWRQETE